MGSEAAKSSGYVSSTAPGFANEKKVDHAALVIEVCPMQLTYPRLLYDTNTHCTALFESVLPPQRSSVAFKPHRTLYCLSHS